MMVLVWAHWINVGIMHSNNQHILWKPGISGIAKQVDFFICARPDPQSNSVLNSLVWKVSLLEKYQGERVNYKYQSVEWW